MSGNRLSSRTAAVPRPGATGIVHIGLGAFHRAHQAVYTEDAMRASGDRSWGIAGATQRSDRVREQLEPQDNLYTVVERGDGAAPPRIVGALTAVVNGRAVPDLMARADIRIVTLTITEKGYRHDPSTRRLDLTDPEIAGDLTGRPPATVVGGLVRGLERRAGGPPLTVMCCDNLPANGPFLRGLVHDFCAAAGLGRLGEWIEGNVRFPSSMVDRITPATTDADLREAERLLGYRDEGLVVTEPFRQWVIEDGFAADRPAWDAVGALLTSDIAPWERLKLRVLNAGHSMLAYFGLLTGHATIDAAVRDPVLRDACRDMITEDVLPTLDPPREMDVRAYAETTLARFANPALRHTTAQVASDGSQKIGPRLLGTVADLRAAGREPKWIPYVIAAWLHHVATTEELRDPLAAELRAARSPLDLRRIFPEDPPLHDRVTRAAARLAAGNPRTVLREVLDERV